VSSGPGLRGENVSDDSFLVDYKTYAAGEETKGLLDLVGFPYRAVRVTEQYERQVVLLGEVSMRVLAIGAYSNNFCA